MVGRGRPPLDYEPVIIQIGDLRLHPEHDADLIEFFTRVPRRQRISAIKAGLRSGGLPNVAAELKNEDAELTEAAGDFL